VLGIFKERKENEKTGMREKIGNRRERNAVEEGGSP